MNVDKLLMWLRSFINRHKQTFLMMCLHIIFHLLWSFVESKRINTAGVKKDILIAICSEGEKRGVWILEGSRWIKQCDVPKGLPERGIRFCAVADGLLAMGGEINGQISPSCYHYSLSEKRWRKLPDMITPQVYAKAVEISPMYVMVVSGGHYCSQCHILDMKRGVWSSVKPLPRQFTRVRVAATGGRVFIMGLYSVDNAPNYEILEYHRSSDTYTSVQRDDRPKSNAQQFWRGIILI